MEGFNNKKRTYHPNKQITLTRSSNSKPSVKTQKTHQIVIEKNKKTLTIIKKGEIVDDKGFSAYLPAFHPFTLNYQLKEFVPNPNYSYFFVSENNTPHPKLINSRRTNIYTFYDLLDAQRFRYYPGTKNVYSFFGFENSKTREEAKGTKALIYKVLNNAINNYPFEAFESRKAIIKKKEAEKEEKKKETGKIKIANETNQEAKKHRADKEEKEEYSINEEKENKKETNKRNTNKSVNKEDEEESDKDISFDDNENNEEGTNTNIKEEKENNEKEKEECDEDDDFDEN